MKTKTYIPVVIMAICLSCTSLLGQTQVIAHRGYWDCEGSAQNSITALKKAQEAGVYGSEFDVLLTSDGVPVVNHDDKIQGLLIEDTPYKKLKNIQLKNGETLPTLKAYLKQGKKHPNTKLILEIKSHSTPQKEAKAVAVITQLVSKLGLDEQVEYISFSLYICQQLVKAKPTAQVAYLNGDLSPQEVKEQGIKGLDYHFNIFKTHPNWIEETKQLGLTTNVWTVNDESLMQEMINAKVDFITTDKPLLLKSLLGK